MDLFKSFIITHDMKVEFKNVQLSTEIVITVNSSSGRQSICLDVDKWTELKKSIFDIDKEFYKRFNYQYPDLNKKFQSQE